MKKAYAYLRVSGLGQKDGDGFRRQLAAIRKFAAGAGFEIVDVYKDAGVSGTLDETQRPAFQDMLTQILRNGVDTIIVEGLDRLARELRIQEQITLFLVAKGIQLWSARTEENVTAAYNSDPMKRALVQIQGVFSELEKALLVKKLRVAREQVRAERGRCEGRKPYGETAGEQAVIRRIRAMRRKRKGGFKGMSMRAIAERLNGEGIPTKGGAQWTATQVHRILHRKTR